MRTLRRVCGPLIKGGMATTRNGARPVRERILVVDDEQNARVALRTILSEEGYEIAEAADGEEALALLPGFAPAAVLADVRMPRLDGMALLQRAREGGSDAASSVAATSPPAPRTGSVGGSPRLVR